MHAEHSVDALVVDEGLERWRDRLRIAIAVAAILGWLGLFLVGMVTVVALNTFGDVVACDHPTNDSDYGEVHWSIFPPGPYCVWSRERGNVVDDTSEPGLAFSLWL